MKTTFKTITKALLFSTFIAGSAMASNAPTLMVEHMSDALTENATDAQKSILHDLRNIDIAPPAHAIAEDAYLGDIFKPIAPASLTVTTASAYEM